jgi:hypothetical protein
MATSNIVVDTQSMSIEIGAGGSGIVNSKPKRLRLLHSKVNSHRFLRDSML